MHVRQYVEQSEININGTRTGGIIKRESINMSSWINLHSRASHVRVQCYLHQRSTYACSLSPYRTMKSTIKPALLASGLFLQTRPGPWPVVTPQCSRCCSSDFLGLVSFWIKIYQLESPSTATPNFIFSLFFQIKS